MELNQEIITTPPRPAATVVMLRDMPGGLEVFIIKRHGLAEVVGGVAGGAPAVAPGGVVGGGSVGAAGTGGQGGGAASFEADAELFPGGQLCAADVLVGDFDSEGLVGPCCLEGDAPGPAGAEAVHCGAGDFDVDEGAGIERGAEASGCGRFDSDYSDGRPV